MMPVLINISSLAFLFFPVTGVASPAPLFFFVVGVDTVVGVGELFQKETWVALGEFVSELDDWETVKAVGEHEVPIHIHGEHYASVQVQVEALT